MFKSLSRQAGFILMPIISIFLLLAMVAYLLNSSNQLELRMVKDETSPERMDFMLDAAEAHFLWLNNQQSCVNYTTLSNVTFGPNQYSATPAADNGSPIDLTLSATNQSGDTVTEIRQVNLYDPLLTDVQLASIDSDIRQANPNSNYGPGTTLQLDSSSGAAIYPLVQFDLSTLPIGAEVISATLDLYVETTGASTAGASIIAYPMKSPWTEIGVSYSTSDGAILWNYMENYQTTNPSKPVALDPIITGWYQWDVTHFIPLWLADTSKNSGLTLIGSSQVKGVSLTSRSGPISTNRPLLNIRYRVACGAGAGPATTDVTIEISMAADTYIAQNNANLNFGREINFLVGLHNERHTLLLPDLSSIPAGALIQSAKLRLFLDKQDKDNTESLDPIVMEVFPLTVPWDEGTNDGTIAVPNDGASWNERKPTLTWTGAGGDGDYQIPNVGQVSIPFAAKAEWITVNDIVAIVQEWVDGVSPNYGLILTGTHGNTQRFISNDDIQPGLSPIIEVVYTPP